MDKLTVEQCVATLKLLLGDQGYKKWCAEQWRLIDRTIEQQHKHPETEAMRSLRLFNESGAKFCHTCGIMYGGVHSCPTKTPEQ